MDAAKLTNIPGGQHSASPNHRPPETMKMHYMFLRLGSIFGMCMHTYIYIYTNGGFLKYSEMGVSPKSSILIGISMINHPFLGTAIYGKPPYLYYLYT